MIVIRYFHIFQHLTSSILEKVHNSNLDFNNQPGYQYKRNINNRMQYLGSDLQFLKMVTDNYYVSFSY